MSSTTGRRVVELLTNKSGGAVAAGDVVVLDSSNDSAFTTSTAGGVLSTIGVAQEAIANNGTGRVCTAGQVDLVNVNASVTRGNYGKTHTVVKQGTDAGSSRASGAFCQFLTAGTTPKAHLFGIADASTSSGGGISAGTSFPGSPANNDLFYRTDRDILYFYDSTATQWMSVELYELTLLITDELLAIATSGRRFRMPVPYKATYSLYLTTMDLMCLIIAGGGGNDGSNYWNLSLYRHDSADSTTQLGSTVTTQSGGTGTWLQKTITVNANLSTGAFVFSLQATKTSSPNTLLVMGTLYYRLIG